MKDLLHHSAPVGASPCASNACARVAIRFQKALSANAPDAYAFVWAAVAIGLAKMGVLQEFLL